jgi:hypothetical protein
MDLSDGPARERLEIEGGKLPLDRRLIGPSHQGSYVSLGRRRAVVLQPPERNDHIGVEQVRAGAENLAQLDVKRTQPPEIFGEVPARGDAAPRAVVAARDEPITKQVERRVDQQPRKSE